MTVYSIEQRAQNIRGAVIKMLLAAGSGHPAGSLGLADVFAALYFRILDHKPTKPDWPDRDRLIVSNGHIVPLWYATLAEAGYFPKSRLVTLRQAGSALEGHPHRGSVPGIENTAGPLGQGASLAVGQALALRLNKSAKKIYVVLSDGEHQEGQTWEAYMAAAKYRLSNLTFIIDRNNIQIDGFTEDVMPLEPLRAKIEAFGWHVLEVDGHNVKGIIDACAEAQAIYEKPVAIIAHTIPGKGVDFMEFDPKWHGLAPSSGEAQRALRQLHTLQGRISAEHE